MSAGRNAGPTSHAGPAAGGGTTESRPWGTRHFAEPDAFDADDANPECTARSTRPAATLNAAGRTIDGPARGGSSEPWLYLGSRRQYQ